MISGVFVLLAALVPVILSAAHSANSGKANSSNRVRPSGSILTPADGAVKQSPVVVTGTAENVRRGYQLDLFSKINDDPRYYAAGDPESTVYFSNGRWSATINFGKATGAIAIWLVELSPQNVRKMNSESHDQAIGFPGLLGTVLAFERFTVK